MHEVLLLSDLTMVSLSYFSVLLLSSIGFGHFGIWPWFRDRQRSMPRTRVPRVGRTAWDSGMAAWGSALRDRGSRSSNLTSGKGCNMVARFLMDRCQLKKMELEIVSELD